jgi:predicted naringenin-chalcone synthase
MYRDITIDNVTYHADLGILIDHRITIKNEEVSVSADLKGRTPDADFEATFTGRGERCVLVAPEEHDIGDAEFEPGDDVKIAKAEKLPVLVAQLDALDQKQVRPMAAVVAATATGQEAPAADLSKIEELEERKAVLRAAIAELNAAETIEDVEAVSWE